jgi:hypothetical protein
MGSRNHVGREKHYCGISNKEFMSRQISQYGLEVVLDGDGSVGTDVWRHLSEAVLRCGATRKLIVRRFAGYSFFVADRLEAVDERRAPHLRETTSAQRTELKQQHFGDAS